MIVKNIEFVIEYCFLIKIKKKILEFFRRNNLGYLESKEN